MSSSARNPMPVCPRPTPIAAKPVRNGTSTHPACLLDSGVVEEAVELFVLRSLWGNKADLSLFSVSEDPLALVHQKLSKGKARPPP